jgi:pimeloyl-ACP methyl ester carboxylesterase
VRGLVRATHPKPTLAFREREARGRAIVLVHGAGTSAALWRRAWPFLARATSARLLAVDLPGHGRSEGAAPRSIASHREALHAFLRALSVERPILVGHSMGGAVCLDYAAAYPGEAALLGIVSCASSFGSQREALALIDERPGRLASFLGSRLFDPAFAERDAAAATRELVTARLETLRGDFEACDAFDFGERAATLRLPCVLVCGEGDRVTPSERSRRLATLLERSSFHSISGAGHMLPYEQPEALVDALVSAGPMRSVLGASAG